MICYTLLHVFEVSSHDTVCEVRTLAESMRGKGKEMEKKWQESAQRDNHYTGGGAKPTVGLSLN